MMRAVFCLLCLAGPGAAEVVVAARTIPAETVITADDITLREIDGATGETDPLLFIGMEARVALYAGRPIAAGDVGPPATVDRNDIITLVFRQGGLLIQAEGRALGRGGPGDLLRVMNLASRNTVSAVVQDDGTAVVTGVMP